MIAFGLLLAMAGIIMLIITVVLAIQNRYYATDTDTTFGSVIRKRCRKLKNGTSYELTVSYVVNGISYEKVVNALKSEYETISEGHEIELCYKPHNPKRAIRPNELNPRNVRIMLIITIVLIVIGALLFFCGRMLIGE